MVESTKSALPERFWAKVNKTDTCWLWTASKNDKGYGTFRFGKKVQKAHRLAYQNLVGPIPYGMKVDHRCHTPACVRPAHLRAVTHKQNHENRKGANHKSASGVLGVNRHTDTGRWVVQVMHNGKAHYGGLFDDVPQAERAATELRNKLFSHNDLDRV